MWQRCSCRLIPASQRQQLAGSKSLPRSPSQKCKPGDIFLARLSLGPPEPAHRQSQDFGKLLSVYSIFPGSVSQPFHKQRLCQCQVQGRMGSPCQAARGAGGSTPLYLAPAVSSSPGLCLSHKVSLLLGLTIFSVICPCGN